jgi:hypothetical protein
MASVLDLEPRRITVDEYHKMIGAGVEELLSAALPRLRIALTDLFAD